MINPLDELNAYHFHYGIPEKVSNETCRNMLERAPNNLYISRLRYSWKDIWCKSAKEWLKVPYPLQLNKREDGDFNRSVMILVDTVEKTIIAQNGVLSATRLVIDEVQLATRAISVEAAGSIQGTAWALIMKMEELA